MNEIFVLAQATEYSSTQEDVQIVPVDFIWEQITALSWLQAIIAISFGMVYMLYGWRIFKILVIISFGLLGMYLGMLAGRNFGSTMNSEIWGGIVGLMIFSFVSMPLMKWCVSILGALAGGILTGGLWYAFELPEKYIWAGAIIGVVAGGMVSFIALRAAVMLFTSLGGSVITVVGIMALLHLYENTNDPVTTHVHDLLFNNNWFMPVALLVPTIAGIITQNKFIKDSPKWEL